MSAENYYKGNSILNLNRKTSAKNISPEKAVEIFKKYGTKVSIEDAQLILDFMNKMADLTIKSHQKNEFTKKTDHKIG